MKGTSQSINKIIKKKSKRERKFFLIGNRERKERKKELTSSLRLSPIIITSFGRTSQSEQI